MVQQPAPDENGVERQSPRNAADAWWFKVKDGVKQVRFGDPGWRLGYARDALNSYFVFQTMKEKGVLPAHLRFQVSVPMVNSVLPPRIFPDQNDLAKIRPGYEAAIRAELATIIEKIPANELAIQWDCSTEVQDAYGSIPGYPLEGSIERNLTEVRNLSPHIPAASRSAITSALERSAAGRASSPTTWDRPCNSPTASSKPRGAKSIGFTFRCSTAATTRSFAPLRELEPQGARVYLGMIHNMARFKARLATARKYISDFGLGAYCGFGRMPVSELPNVLAAHLEAVDIARRG